MINFNLNKIPLVYSTTGDTEKEIDVYFNYPSLSIDFFVDFNQVHSIKCESVDDAVGKLGNLTPQKINNKLKQPLIVELFCSLIRSRAVFLNSLYLTSLVTSHFLDLSIGHCFTIFQTLFLTFSVNHPLSRICCCLLFYSSDISLICFYGVLSVHWTHRLFLILFVN